jgi:hypothetical protein
VLSLSRVTEFAAGVTARLENVFGSMGAFEPFIVIWWSLQLGRYERSYYLKFALVCERMGEEDDRNRTPRRH